MGAGQEKEALPFFKGVGSGEQEPRAADYAEGLAAYSAGLCSGAELGPLSHACARAAVQRQLALGTTAPSRVGWVLRYCREQWEAVLKGGAGAGPVALAALRVSELLLRHAFAVVRGKSAPLLELMEYPASSKPRAPKENEGGKLCNVLVHYAAQVPLTAETVTAHAEVARFLLSSTATALHHGTDFDEEHMDVFTEVIMSSPALGPLLRVLLARLVAWGQQKQFGEPFYRYAEPPARGWLGWLGGGGAKAKESAEEKAREAAGEDLGLLRRQCSHWEQAYRHSVDLLSVLVAHQKGNGKNPALDFVVALADDESFSFKALLSAAAARLVTAPSICMLLYVFFHDHPTFLGTTVTTYPTLVMETVVATLHLTFMASVREAEAAEEAARADVPAVPEGSVLEEATLRAVLADFANFSYPFINFMTGTLLLLLSQDAVVNKLVSDLSVDASFLPARTGPGGGGAAGKTQRRASSVMLTVLSAGIVRALNERNEPLAAIFLPCLANSAAFVHDMDSATAQRTIAMLALVVRKVQRTQSAYEAVLARDPSDFPPRVGSSETPEQLKASAVLCVEEAGDLFVRQLAALAGVVETMLRDVNRRRNVPLLYELLYSKAKLFDDVVVPGGGADRFVGAARDAMAGLRAVAEHYDAMVAKANVQSAADIVRLIESESDAQVAALASPAAAAAPAADGELVYSYEESPNSYDFFGPFLWVTLLLDASRPGGILFATSTRSIKIVAKS